MVHVLVGIDPGLTTGWCLIDITDPENPIPLEDAELDVIGFYEKFESTIEKYDGSMAVVIENFIITARTAKLSQAPWSLELIGVTKYLTSKYGIPLTIQKPSDKEFADNTKLRKVGFWSKGTEGHSIDAYRHCMVFLIHKYPKWGKKLVM